jgi:hypothetical protein
MEAYDTRGYQLVNAWTPTTGDPVKALGLFMLTDLAGLHLTNAEVY